MKTQFAIILAASMALLATSCISISRQSFHKSDDFNPKGTFKVVTVNTNDLVLGKLEHQLALKGFTVIADNRVSGNVPVGMSTVTTFDSTYQVDNFRLVSMQIFENKEADYIIRYQVTPAASFTKTAYANLDIEVINAKTGRTEATYNFWQNPVMGWGKRRADKVLRQFVEALAGK
ncbi:MAG: hypothetical protein JNK77_18760 [Saprospiraceae bacterium]|nr:hypothetical protein [Saprospiraceae bacterium]